MTQFFFDSLRWPLAATALAVFGFAPGAIMRVIVRVYKRDDPRRRELMAEVYSRPRLDRPFWVAQQLEVALFDGLAYRIGEAFRRHAPHRKLSGWFTAKGNEFYHAEPELTILGLALAWSATALCAFAFVYMRMQFRSLPSLFVMLGTLLLWLLIGQLDKGRSPWVKTKMGMVKSGIELILLALMAPLAYSLACYSVIHNLLGLISGNLSHGYWIGILLSLFGLNIPFELAREAKVAAWADQQKKRLGAAGA